MKKSFISLTQMNMAPAILRTDKIISIQSSKEGTTVEYKNGNVYKVREHHGEIVKMIGAAKEKKK